MHITPDEINQDHDMKEEIKDDPMAEVQKLPFTFEKFR